MTAELVSRINELFEYDRENGRLISKISRGSRAVGSVAGYQDTDGYVRVKIDGVVYVLHQLIWLIETGVMVFNLDHRDGNPSNNKHGNLRVSTQQQNRANSRLPSHNTSGHKGVAWVESRRKYIARIKVDGKIVFLGYHETLDQAIRAYQEASESRFGEFAYHRRQQ